MWILNLFIIGPWEQGTCDKDLHPGASAEV